MHFIVVTKIHLAKNKVLSRETRHYGFVEEKFSGIYKDPYLEPSRKSTMELFCESN